MCHEWVRQSGRVITLRDVVFVLLVGDSNTINLLEIASRCSVFFVCCRLSHAARNRCSVRENLFIEQQLRINVTPVVYVVYPVWA